MSENPTIERISELDFLETIYEFEDELAQNRLDHITYSSITAMQTDETLNPGDTAIINGAIYDTLEVTEVEDESDMTDPDAIYLYNGTYYKGDSGEEASGFASENGFVVVSDKNIFVTPEMFGAKGDGMTDDTEAIQAAINSGFPVILTSKVYLTNDTIYLKNRNRINFMIVGGQLRYEGTGYAIEVSNVNGGNIDIDRIFAPNGSCIKFVGKDGLGVQYVKFNFLWLSCNGRTGMAIRVENDATGWCSQNEVHGGEIQECAYAISAEVHANATHACNQWLIDITGFEGVSSSETCIKLKGTAKYPIRNWTIRNFRNVENTGSKFIDMEHVRDLEVYGRNGIDISRITVTGTDVFGTFNTRLIDGNSMLAASFYYFSGVMYYNKLWSPNTINTSNIANYSAGSVLMDRYDNVVMVHGNVTMTAASRRLFISGFLIPDELRPINRTPVYVPMHGEDGSTVMLQVYADGTTYAQNAALQANVKYYFNACYIVNGNHNV